MRCSPRWYHSVYMRNFDDATCDNCALFPQFPIMNPLLAFQLRVGWYDLRGAWLRDSSQKPEVMEGQR